MNYSRIINGAFIIIGAIVAVYAQANEQQNQYVLIFGIVFLMIGLYRMSRNINSKSLNNNEIEDDINNEV